jgi:hypothetical protein
MLGRVWVAVWAMALLLVALVAACGTPAPTQAYSIGVANGTTLTVTIFVNGRAVETFGPGSGTGMDGIPANQIGPLPWSVEARSPSGRVLTSMTVHEGDVSSTTLPGGGGSSKGVGGRVDLSCGRLDIWSGPPPIGPMPGSGSPGDCAP